MGHGGLLALAHTRRVAALAASLALLSGCAVVDTGPGPTVVTNTSLAPCTVERLPGPLADYGKPLEPWVVVGDTAYGADGEARYRFAVPEGAHEYASVEYVEVSPDRTHAAVLSMVFDEVDATQLFWVPLAGDTKSQIVAEGGQLQYLASDGKMDISTGGRFLLFEDTDFAREGYFSEMQIWDSSTGLTVTVDRPRDLTAEYDWVHELQLSDDGSTLLHSSVLGWSYESGKEDHAYAQLLDLESGEVIDLGFNGVPGRALVQAEINGDASVLLLSVSTLNSGLNEVVVYRNLREGVQTYLADTLPADSAETWVTGALMSHDGSAVYFQGVELDGEELRAGGLFRFDAATGEATKVVATDREITIGPIAVPLGVSDDGTVVAFESYAGPLYLPSAPGGSVYHFEGYVYDHTARALHPLNVLTAHERSLLC